jgi:hypothetical protein
MNSVKVISSQLEIDFAADLKVLGHKIHLHFVSLSSKPTDLLI